MTKLEEIIQQQQELIEQYKLLASTYKDSQDKLYDYINQIHRLLVTEDPIAIKTAMAHLGKLAEKAKQ
jgi:dihydrodipicolinate synthase/N-acetylneuraminate lyase